MPRQKRRIDGESGAPDPVEQRSQLRDRAAEPVQGDHARRAAFGEKLSLALAEHALFAECTGA
jgi:hypothetical protein